MDKLELVSRELKYKGHRVKVYEDTLHSPDGRELYYDYVENRNGSGVLLVDDEGKLLFVRQYRNCINDMDIEIPAGCVELNDFNYKHGCLTEKNSDDNTENNRENNTENNRENNTENNRENNTENNTENNNDNYKEKNTDNYNVMDYTLPDNPFYLCAMREAEEETGYIPQKLRFVNYIIAAVGLFSERTAVYIGTDLVKGHIDRDPDEFIDIIRLTPEEAMNYVSEGKINDSKTIVAIYAYVMSKP